MECVLSLLNGRDKALQRLDMAHRNIALKALKRLNMAQPNISLSGLFQPAQLR